MRDYSRNRPISILMADDDEEDCVLTAKAFRKNHFGNELHFVHDGEELLDYLHNRGRFADAASHPQPGLILLDLNMPRMDGREALEALKSDPRLRHIPVVVLTSSKAELDVVASYNLGVNSYITKPVTFEGLVSVVGNLGNYWFNLVELPPEEVEV